MYDTRARIAIPGALLEAAERSHGTRTRWIVLADAGRGRYIWRLDPDAVFGGDDARKWLQTIVARSGADCYPLRVQWRSDEGPLLAEAVIWGDADDYELDEDADDDDGRAFLPARGGFEAQQIDAHAETALERAIRMCLEQPEVLKGAVVAIVEAFGAVRNHADAAVIEAACERSAEMAGRAAAQAAHDAVQSALARYAVDAGYELDEFSGEVLPRALDVDAVARPGVPLAPDSDDDDGDDDDHDDDDDGPPPSAYSLPELELEDPAPALVYAVEAS